ncbi:MAG: hypothetical protein IPG99_05975 [Ignavibacteria bacterium]|nr:hypothetical protein [Ignavibacteria bacterium]
MNDVEFVTYSELTEDDKMIVNSYFEDELFPILTPLAIDNVHPFPNLINRSLALAIILDDPDTEQVEEKVCVIQLPNNISRFYSIGSNGDYRFILLEEIIRQMLTSFSPE